MAGNKITSLKPYKVHTSIDERLRRMTGDKKRYNNPATVILKKASNDVNIDDEDRQRRNRTTG